MHTRHLTPPIAGSTRRYASSGTQRCPADGQKHPGPDGGSRRAAPLLTLDDPVVLAAVTEDPRGFINGLQGPVILDEIQRAPDVFLAIKAAVDQHRQPGRFQ